MFRISRVSSGLLFVLSFSTLLSAQEQRGADGPKLSPVITAATAGEKVRFGSPAAGIAQIRVQIISATGDALFDSAWKDGNLFDWPIETAGQPLANGSYRCVVKVRDLDGRVTSKEAVLAADGGQISIEPLAGDAGLTTVGAGESGPKITMLAHDEEKGAIVNTSGDLSFRFGEFFAGKDSERMRLTAEGRLGIGTDTPQAPLDVNGLIRTSKGIMFPDGTIQTTAGGEAMRAQERGAGPVTRVVGGELASGSQMSAGARRLTPRVNATGHQFVVDSAGVHIGTSSAYGLDVAGNVTLSSNLSLPESTSTAGSLVQFGVPLLHTRGSHSVFVGRDAGNFTMTGSGNNTTIGALVLRNNVDGFNNTAGGVQTLFKNTTGHSNTAFGLNALFANIGGFSNTGIGIVALLSNTNGIRNSALGESALTNNTVGNDNVAVGSLALPNNTEGSLNTAIGRVAMFNNSTGSNNIAVGVGAGQLLTTGSNNVAIANDGVAGEAGTIRIGTSGTQTRAFLAGVRDISMANGVAVLIDAAGQLGTAPSSAMVKRDIAGVGDQTSSLMKLRPVSFFYRSDTAGIRQYGLIAEEVAEVMPDLVQFSDAGKAETVRYHFLAPLLLDHVQKQDRLIEDLNKTIDALNTTVALFAQRLQALERQDASR